MKMINEVACVLLSLVTLAFFSTFFINELLPKPIDNIGTFRILFGISWVMLICVVLITLPKKDTDTQPKR